MSERHTERRVVTALFVDVVGSVALTARLGAERLKRMLDRAFDELSAVIGTEGGTVEKYAGDAIHALFGAPIAHSDDPLRALRAAWGCLVWAERQAGEPLALAVRIGVETGEAIVDLGAAEGARQQMSIGAAVNLAARLQQVAEPGQALVGPTCREATADVAEFHDLPEVDLKGLGPVRVARLVGLRATRAAARMPFVGREAELDLLRVAFRRAASGRGVLALVSGPPGQGKSRLVEEAVARLETVARVLQARCRPGGETGVRNPLRDLLVAADSAPSAEALAAALTDLIADPGERRRVVTALLHSAGVQPLPELAGLGHVERMDEVTDAWRRYLGALARHQPLVVWIEDLHWAEAELVLLLDRLTSGALAPVLVIATARPQFAEQAALRPSGDRFFVELDALDAEAARALARHAGARDALALDRAGGNPLFIIELSRSRGVASGADVPLSLQAAIGARLDELSPAERELLQRAAVIGESFDARGAGIVAGRDPADVTRTLARLADLLYLQAVPGGYRFHHALLRDVAYGRLPTAERMRLHAAYARQGLAAKDFEALAHHLWQAVGLSDAEWVWEGSDERSTLRAEAFRAHAAAGLRCAERFAYERAIEAYRRALTLAPGPAETALVECAVADAHAAQGQADEAWSRFMEARRLHRQAGGDPPATVYATLLELAVFNFGMFRDRPDEGLIEALGAEGEGVATRTADHAALARLLAVRSYRSDDLAPLDEGMRLFERASDPTPFAPFLHEAAVRQVRLGEFDAAEGTFRRLDALAAAGGRLDPSWRLEYRGILALVRGDVGAADRAADEFVAGTAARGPHLQTHAYREKVHVALSRGDWAGVRAVSEVMARLVQRHPGTSFCFAVTTAYGFAAAACALEGRADEARALVSRSETPLHAPPFDRETILLLAYGVVGRWSEVDRIRRAARDGDTAVPWFFRRAEAVVLTMAQRWDELDDLLVELERAAANGSRYLPALAGAIREERAAASGAPAPTHAALRGLGHVGWSQLLRHRPPAA